MAVAQKKQTSVTQTPLRPTQQPGHAPFAPARPVEETKETTVAPKQVPYVGVDVDSKLQDRRFYISYVEGASLVVEYYSQHVGADDQGNHHSLDTPEFLQQYRCIKGLQLKVTSPFSPNFNDKNEWEGTGTATVLPGLKPNVGDLFISDVGEGRSGVFNVVSVKENSYFKDTTYEIEFSLRTYLTEKIHQDLKGKTIEQLVFVKDVQRFGENPFYTEARFNLRQRLLRHEQALAMMLYDRFVDNEEFVFLLPIQGQRIYDHAMAKLFRDTLITTNNVWYNSLRELNVDRAGGQYSKTVWDMILLQEPFMLPMVDQDLYIINRKWFKAPAFLSSVYYSTVDYIIMPQRYLAEKQTGGLFSSLVGKPLPVGYSLFKDFGEVDLNALEAQQAKTTPLIYPVNRDDAYVFTQAFYQQQREQMSTLEQLTWDLIERKPVNELKLEALLEECKLWGTLEQFYYYPLLILMIREVANRA